MNAPDLVDQSNACALHSYTAFHAAVHAFVCHLQAIHQGYFGYAAAESIMANHHAEDAWRLIHAARTIDARGAGP